MFDSLVRVSRRVVNNHYASILAKSAVLGPRKGIMQRAITLPKELRSLSFYPPTETDAGLDLAKCTGEEHRMIR
jgi:hypothetical protein